jgi:hypothetical protein
VLATALWLVASVLFSWYLQNFANYNATYGSLGAVIGFMMWTWISVVILLGGAELNAELEHQTARDSTTGPELPMGARGATMADTLGAPRGSAAAEAATSGQADTPPLSRARRAPEPPPRRTPELGTVLGFALPFAAVGAALLWDRRTPSRGKIPPPAPRESGASLTQQRLAAATDRLAPLLRQSSALLSQPALREFIAHARRQAAGRRRPTWWH